MKRFDAVTRSPIFAWFSESLAGLSTIRAFNQQSLFIAANQRRIDHNQVCYLPSVSVNRWLSVRLEFLGAVIILTVAFLAMSALITTGVDAGLVGLVLSYALNTTSALVSEPVLQCLCTILTLYQSRTGQCVQQVKSNRTLSALNVYYTRLRWNRKRPMKFQKQNQMVYGHRKVQLNFGEIFVLNNFTSRLMAFIGSTRPDTNLV